MSEGVIIEQDLCVDAGEAPCLPGFEVKRAVEVRKRRVFLIFFPYGYVGY